MPSEETLFLFLSVSGVLTLNTFYDILSYFIARILWRPVYILYTFRVIQNKRAKIKQDIGDDPLNNLR